MSVTLDISMVDLWSLIAFTLAASRVKKKQLSEVLSMGVEGWLSGALDAPYIWWRYSDAALILIRFETNWRISEWLCNSLLKPCEWMSRATGHYFPFLQMCAVHKMGEIKDFQQLCFNIFDPVYKCNIYNPPIIYIPYVIFLYIEMFYIVPL